MKHLANIYLSWIFVSPISQAYEPNLPCLDGEIIGSNCLGSTWSNGVDSFKKLGLTYRRDTTVIDEKFDTKSFESISPDWKVKVQEVDGIVVSVHYYTSCTVRSFIGSSSFHYANKFSEDLCGKGVDTCKKEGRFEVYYGDGYKIFKARKSVAFIRMYN